MADAPERTLSEHHVTPATLAEADERLRDVEVALRTVERERDRLREVIREIERLIDEDDDGVGVVGYVSVQALRRALTEGENE